MKFVIFILISTCCLVPWSCANRPSDLNVKVKPYSIPFGRYHCYLRLTASCFHETNVRTSYAIDDPAFCVDPIAYGFFKLRPLINCTENDLACWKSCNHTFRGRKFRAGPNLAAPIFQGVEYAIQETFDPKTLNLTWSPVKGAYLYVVQYFDTLDIYSTWDVGSGRPMITNRPYLIFKKENLCSNYKFRIAAVSSGHVSAFSNVLESPNEYPKDVHLKLSLANVTTDVDHHSQKIIQKLDKRLYENKIVMQLNYSNPLLTPRTMNSKEGLVRERVYIRAKGDIFVELKKQPVSFTNRTVHYLLPKDMLNSGNEILFVRKNFKDSCDRRVMANTAVKVVFTCGNGAQRSCQHRKHYDLMESVPKYFPQNDYHNRRLLELDESGVAALVKKFHQKINISHYESICDIEKPSMKPEETFTLTSYQTVTYCGLTQPTEAGSMLVARDAAGHVPLATKIDNQLLTSGQRDGHLTTGQHDDGHLTAGQHDSHLTTGQHDGHLTTGQHGGHLTTGQHYDDHLTTGQRDDGHLTTGQPDGQLTSGHKDDENQFYTIRIKKTTLTVLLKIGLVVLCVVIALAIVGLSLAGFKIVRVKHSSDKGNNAILIKSSAKPPYTSMPKE